MPVYPGSARVVLATTIFTLGGCVKKSTHQATLIDLSRASADREALLVQVEELEGLHAGLLRDMESERTRRDAAEASLRGQIAQLEADLERSEAQRRESDALLSERGAEYRQLQSRLESLRAIEREVRERNAIYEDVIGRFQSLIDGGRLSVAIVRGRMVIQLPQDILFPSGSAVLGRDGRAVIAEVGGVLAGLEERRFQVEGHTDNVPISTAQFPSNWELSSARALAVVKLMAQQGVLPTNISGAAYGEYQPVAPNDDRDSRRLNRRIEIVMLPNLDVIAAAQLPG